MKLTALNAIRNQGKKISNSYKDIPLRLKHPEIFDLIVMYILVPFIVNLIITCMELKSPVKGFAFLFKHFYAFIANVLIIQLTICWTLLFKRRIFFVSICSTLWVAFGITNLVLLLNRVTPFCASDLYMIESLPEMLNRYFNFFQIILLGILVLLALVILVELFIFAPKWKAKIKYHYVLATMALTFGLTVGGINLGVKLGFLEGQFAELSAAYRNNGFVYCFTNSLIDTGVSKPKNYSAESLAEMVKNDNLSITGDEADITPNIIYIQLETFFNIQELNDVTFSDTVLPNFTALQEECGGLFDVPVIGAGTVNTEFEVLTGMTMDDFGAGEYPFKTILKETSTENLAFNLKTYGYNTHALHDNTGKFYSRDVVYANLGFDDFTSVEYMLDYETTNLGWAKDSVLTKYIMQCMEETEGQDLVYTISVQGHGGYNTTEDYEHHITVTDIAEDRLAYKDQIEYYANMLYEMDQFIGELIATLNEFDEPTVLVMYGDHLPSLDIRQEELDNRTLYQTDYVIWNNCDLPFKSRNLSSDEITNYVYKTLGMENGIINAFRQKHSKDYDFAESLQALEYDMLYGDQIVYGGYNPYVKSELKMGLDPIYVTKVFQDPLNEDTYYVKGVNFTKYSKVYIDGSSITTTLVDQNTLTFEYEKGLPDNSVINVWQSKLSCTEDYIYRYLPLERVEIETEEEVPDTEMETEEN